MTWLVWRQSRAAAAIAAALLAMFAALLAGTGLSMAAQWHSVLTSCTVADNCDRAALNTYLGTPAMQVLVVATMAVPAVFGLLWGVPLVAHETETGTRVYAWTQAVTRRRWLAVKTGWTLLAASVFGGVVAGLVTWWSGPKNALYQNAFDPGVFDLQGVAPIGYALFGTALGIASGALLRRTMPALGVTLAGFLSVRLLVNVFLRQHFMTPVTVYHAPLVPANPAGSAWVLARGVINKYGQAFTGGNGPAVNGVPVSALPASCQHMLFNGPASISRAHLRSAISCMSSQGFRGFTTYQPASRFWAFQGIEAGIFAALAAVLIAVAFAVVTRRDA